MSIMYKKVDKEIKVRDVVHRLFPLLSVYVETLEGVTVQLKEATIVGEGTYYTVGEGFEEPVVVELAELKTLERQTEAGSVSAEMGAYIKELEGQIEAFTCCWGDATEQLQEAVHILKEVINE